MLSQLLQSAQVDWSVAVEASGWELMLYLVRIGPTLLSCEMDGRVPAGTTGVRREPRTITFVGKYLEVTPHSRLSWSNDENPGALSPR